MYICGSTSPLSPTSSQPDTVSSNLKCLKGEGPSHRNLFTHVETRNRLINHSMSTGKNESDGVPGHYKSFQGPFVHTPLRSNTEGDLIRENLPSSQTQRQKSCPDRLSCTREHSHPPLEDLESTLCCKQS